jgi:hypothetical protein
MAHDQPRENRRDEGVEASELYTELHRKYIVALQEKRNTFGTRHVSAPPRQLVLRRAADGLTGRVCAGRAEYAVTEHLRMSGIYWGLTAMYLMSAVHEMKAEEIVEWLMQCQHPSVPAPAPLAIHTHEKPMFRH